MVWLIYAVLRPPRPVMPKLAGTAGVGAAPLALARGGGLAAAVSKHPVPPTPSIEAALAFGDVVTALWERMDLVPMRFGTCVARPEEVAAWLEGERGALAALLESIRGCAEIAVRFRPAQCLSSERLVPSRGAGHAYLAARLRGAGEARERELAAYGQAERIAAALAGGYRRWRFDGVSEGFASADFLVPRALAGTFVRECRRQTQAFGDPFSIGGPWPPYSFAMPDAGRPAAANAPAACAP